jgi:hypothetical protein
MEYLAACQKAQEAVMDSVRQEDFERAAVEREIRVAAEYGASVIVIARCIGKRGFACARIHDIFGNPFRAATLSPAVLAWNDGLVVRLAQSAYDERQLPEGTLDNGRLAILADALEEAGCTVADILGHLRSPGPHVRGCWPVDLVLGKS